MSEFRDDQSSAYRKAKKQGWMEEMTWLELSPLDPGYFSKERIFAFARECKTRTEFHRKYGYAYLLARKNGWLDEMTWFKQLKHRWTKEEIFEVSKEFSSLAEFRKCKPSAYYFAQRRGWIKEMTWLIQKRKNDNNG